MSEVAISGYPIQCGYFWREREKGYTQGLTAGL